MRHSPRAGLVPTVVLPLLLVGCGVSNPAPRDVCTQYRQFQASADALRQLSPQTATAAQYRAAADQAKADLNQMIASADGTLDSSISTVRASLLDVQEAATTASTKGFAAARPMLADSATALKQSLATLQWDVRNACPATGSTAK